MEEASTLKRKGNEEYVKKNYDRAIEYYSAAIKLEPGEPVYFSNRAACFLELGNYPNSVDDCQKALSLLNDSPENKLLLEKLSIRLGRSHFYLGDYAAASLSFEKTSNLDKFQDLAMVAKEKAKEKKLSPDYATQTFHSLDTIRGHLEDGREWFPVGNEDPVSLMRQENENIIQRRPQKSISIVQTIQRNNYKSFRFFFGGAADLRHAYTTLYDFHNQLKDASPTILSDLQLEFHVNDLCSESIARNILLIMGLRDLSLYSFDEITSGQNKAKPSAAIMSASYLYQLWLSCGFAPPLAERFYQQLDRLLEISQNIQSFSESEEMQWIRIERIEQNLPILRSIWQHWRESSKNIHLGPIVQSYQRKVYEEKQYYLKIFGNTDPKSFQEEMDFHTKYGLVRPPVSLFRECANLDLYTVNPTMLWDQLGNFNPFEQYTVNEVADYSFSGLADGSSNIVDGELKGTIFARTSHVFWKWAKAIEFFLNRKSFTMVIHMGDLHVALQDLSTRKPPVLFDRIASSNVVDYCGLANGLLYSSQALKPLSECPHALFDTACLLTRQMYSELPHYLWSILRVRSKEVLPKLYGIKHVTGALGDSAMRWQPLSLPLPSNELFTSTELKEHLLELFLAISLPPSKTDSARESVEEYWPLNMKTFVMLLRRVIKVGYPSHWVSDIVHDIMRGTVSTSARFPTNPAESLPKQIPPKANINTKPFLLDLSILLTIADPTFGFIVPDKLPNDLACYKATVNQPQRCGNVTAPYLTLLVLETKNIDPVLITRHQYPSSRKSFVESFIGKMKGQLISTCNVRSIPGSLELEFWLPKSIAEGSSYRLMMVRVDINHVVKDSVVPVFKHDLIR